MEEFEFREIAKKIYKTITGISKPVQGKGFVDSLYKQTIQNGKSAGFKVNNANIFEPIKFEKQEVLCAQIEVQFGSIKESYRNINSLAGSGAVIGTYITSSKSRAMPLMQLINIFSRIKGTTKKFIVYDIETGHHVLSKIDPGHDKIILFHPIHLFSSYKKHKNIKRKKVYGKRN